MTYTPTPMEQVFRSVREGYCDELMDLTRPENDGMLAPWMRLKMRMEKMCADIQTVCDDIAARPCMNPGQMALRNIAACIPVATPEEDEVFTAYEAEARRVEAKRLEASWNALSDEQKAEAESRLTEEARRIEAAHPTTINMADFAGGLLGIHKRGA